MDYRKLLELCKGRKVWIQTHNFPDADAVASAFALSEFLEHFGIKAKLCHDGEIDRLSAGKMLDLLGITMQQAAAIGDMNEEDMILLVDCQKNTGNTTDLIGNELAVIDHHPTFVKVDYAYEDLRITGACASLVAEYFKTAGIEPSKRAATALLCGLRSDTLRLSRGVTVFDVEMYAWLFPYADPALLGSLETNNLDLGDLHGYESAIANVRLFGTVGFTWLDMECPDALAGILSDFLLSLAEIDVVVLYAKRPNGIKLSLRSERPEVHAGNLAREALKDWGSGGGHASMAGGFVPVEKLPEDPGMRYEAVIAQFTDVIRRMYPQILAETNSSL